MSEQPKQFQATPLLTQKLINDHVKMFIKRRARKEANRQYVADRHNSFVPKVWAGFVLAAIVIIIAIEVGTGVFLSPEIGDGFEWFLLVIGNIVWFFLCGGIIDGVKQGRVNKLWDAENDKQLKEAKESQEVFDLS